MLGTVGNPLDSTIVSASYGASRALARSRPRSTRTKIPTIVTRGLRVLNELGEALGIHVQVVVVPRVARVGAAEVIKRDEAVSM
jgi:hypothetical protein